MRIRRLMLERYGHLSGLDMTFPQTPDLHIVLGANEAGKSTALSAIGDALFRFPQRTPFDFLHQARDLRVGIALQARDGREATFFRRKRREGNDLSDQAGRPLPESAIAAFLSGASRRRFEDVFGLDGPALREGGRSILQGKGEVGEAILGAATGFHHLREVVARLDEEAGRLFGDRRGHREFHEASRRHGDAQRRRDALRVDPAAWKAAGEEVARLEATRREAAGRMQALHAERTRLSRIRATSAARRAILSMLEQRAALGHVPDLPADAEARHREAIEALERAGRDLEREGRRLDDLEEARARLPAQAPVLPLADRIEALRDDVQRIAGAIADREAQRLVEARHAEAMLEEARSLGLGLAVDALAAAIPTTLAREAVTQALKRRSELAGRHLAAAQALAETTSRLEEAGRALAALPAPGPSADLRAATEAVRGEGRLDVLMAEAEAALDAATTTLDEAMAALPLWTGGAAALAAMPLPLEPATERAAALLNAAAAELEATGRALAQRGQMLAELEAALCADAAGGPLPTQQAIAAARSCRDAAWGLIRRAFLDGGAPATDAERDAAGLGADAGAGFEALVRAADRLVDSRAEEQERVVQAEQRLASRAQGLAMRETEAQAHQAATVHRQAALEGWRALWRPAGLVPDDDPAVMRDWLRRRSQALEALRVRREAAAGLESIRRRHREAFDLLAALLPGQAVSARGSVAVLLRAGESVCRAREQAEATYARAAAEAADAGRAWAVAQGAAAAVERDLAAWGDDWTGVAAAIALPPGSDPEGATVALASWTRIEAAQRERRAAQARIAEMTRSIDAFDAEAATIVARLDPGLAGQGSLESVRVLAGRLAQARAEAAESRRLADEAEEVRRQVTAARRTRQAAREALDHLRRLGGADDDEALRRTVACWVEHRALTARIGERERDLDRVNDGRTLAELAEEAEGVDLDALPARIATIDADLAQLRQSDQDAALRLHDLRREMAAMEKGNDAAGAQQDMEAAAAEMDDIAARYVPLRMAGMLLRAGIERYRRTQQGPLLRRAGELFHALTDGRYIRLDTEEDDKGAARVVARREDDTVCPAESLSEGTLDQLYLALRLAAIELDAAATEPLPFIGDDLLVNFDDRRAGAALRVLAGFSRVTQVILFTHHDHVAAMADPRWAVVHALDAGALVT